MRPATSAPPISSTPARCDVASTAPTPKRARPTPRRRRNPPERRDRAGRAKVCVHVRGRAVVLTISERGYGSARRPTNIGSQAGGRRHRRDGRPRAGRHDPEKDRQADRLIPGRGRGSTYAVTDGGQLIRTRVEGIRIVGRSTQGVIVFDTAEGERVVSVERISEEGDETAVSGCLARRTRRIVSTGGRIPHELGTVRCLSADHDRSRHHAGPDRDLGYRDRRGPRDTRGARHRRGHDARRCPSADNHRLRSELGAQERSHTVRHLALGRGCLSDLARRPGLASRRRERRHGRPARACPFLARYHGRALKPEDDCLLHGFPAAVCRSSLPAGRQLAVMCAVSVALAASRIPSGPSRPGWAGHGSCSRGARSCSADCPVSR